jgi:hypothetical protein
MNDDACCRGERAVAFGVDELVNCERQGVLLPIDSGNEVRRGSGREPTNSISALPGSEAHSPHVRCVTVPPVPAAKDGKKRGRTNRPTPF